MRLKPGQVRDSILDYLKGRGRKESTVTEIHAAVVAALGHDVAASSVRSYLNLNTPDTFERVATGRYRLAKGARV